MCFCCCITPSGSLLSTFLPVLAVIPLLRTSAATFAPRSPLSASSCNDS
jgi:hypothetical protein